MFVFRATKLQKANKESAPIIIGAMLKDIGRKYPDGVNDLSKIWDLVSSGTGSTQEAHESFVEKAIESPKLALIVLDQIRKTNPEALEKLRPAILRGRWELGKVFFGIRDIVTQRRTDQQSIAQLNTLWTSSSLQLRAILKRRFSS